MWPESRVSWVPRGKLKCYYQKIGRPAPRADLGAPVLLEEVALRVEYTANQRPKLSRNREVKTGERNAASKREPMGKPRSVNSKGRIWWKIWKGNAE